MHKARKEILKVLNTVDLLIEIVDARLPFSSRNPVIQQLHHQKPAIIVFNKCDLADPEITELWQDYYETEYGLKTLSCQLDLPHKTKQLLPLCKKMVPQKQESVKAINAMIVGIPNVGKSTIINTLAGKIIAKTGNEPAVTKGQQKIKLPHDIMLHDTPGILWPKIENPHSGYRLAISGAIKNTAIEYEDIGFYAAEFFLKYYSKLLTQRYDLTTLPKSPLDLLEAIGYRRGAKQSGGRINLHKACEILLHEYRNKKLGNISLETPEMIVAELKVLAEKNVTT